MLVRSRAIRPPVRISRLCAHWGRSVAGGSQVIPKTPPANWLCRPLQLIRCPACFGRLCPDSSRSSPRSRLSLSAGIADLRQSADERPGRANSGPSRTCSKTESFDLPGVRLLIPAQPALSPQRFGLVEMLWRQCSVPHSVLHICMAEPVLHYAHVSPAVGQKKSAGMAQHVRMDVPQAAGRADCREHLAEP